MISRKRLRELLHYDPATGHFTWLKSTNRRIIPGRRAGTNCRGYLQIRVDGRIYRAHRLAWLYMHGKWPQQHIDHINGNPSDNRLANLRDVSAKINRQNLRKPFTSNSLGLYLGVSPWPRNKKLFRARVGDKHIGLYKTPEAAYEAYVLAKRVMHPGFML